MKLRGLIVTCGGQPVDAFQTTGQGAKHRLAAVRKALQKAYPGCKIERFTQSASAYARTRSAKKR